MDDAVAMSVLESVGDLAGQAQHVGDRERTAQGLAFDVLHNEVVRTHVEQRADVGMVQGRDAQGLVAEALLELLLRDLDRDRPLEPRVAGLVHVAHAARAERAHDLVRAEPSSGGMGHGQGSQFTSTPMG